MGFKQFPIAKYLVCRSVCDYAATIKENNPLAGVQDHVQIVRGDQLGLFQAADRIDNDTAVSS